MADADRAAQAVQLLLVEHLRDEPEIAQRGEPARLRHGDARRLLAAVLQREEPEVREPRDVAVGGVDAEHAAHQRTRPISTKPFEPSRETSSGLAARIAAPRAGSAGSSTSAAQPLHVSASASATSRPP